jgi:GR25 family glycosyltransferase involved in LPS biosynthesis
MRRELTRCGIAPPAFSVHRFDAVDGALHVFTPAERQSFASFDAAGLGNALNAPLIKANALSHLGVWREVSACGVDVALVLQDDVSLRPKGFQAGLRAILANLPTDAWIVWIGLNAYASGPVSRSSALDPARYDPNFYSSTRLPGNAVVGVARPGLVATGTLAYLITAAGAAELTTHFSGTGTGQGWSHHTDHAVVSARLIKKNHACSWDIVILSCFPVRWRSWTQQIEATLLESSSPRRTPTAPSAQTSFRRRQRQRRARDGSSGGFAPASPLPIDLPMLPLWRKWLEWQMIK